LKLEHFDIGVKEELKINSDLISIDPSKLYKWEFEVKGIRGNEKSAYAVLLFVDGKKEFARRKRLIKEWDGQLSKYIIITAVSSQAKFLRVGFRINCQGAKPSHTIIDLPSLNKPIVNVVDNDTPQTYDDPYDYEKDWEKYDLEKNWWNPVGGFKNAEEYDVAGKIKVEILKYFGLKSESTILDIGCGTGVLVKHLEPYLTSLENYTGTDLAQKAIDYCTKNYPKSKFFKNEMTKLPNLNKKFDMICLFSVFTHIYPEEIVEYLKDIKKYLKPNGCIVASIFKNSKIPTYTGTKNRMQLNDNYFFELVRSTGFANIKCHKDEDNSQIVYKIW